MSTSGEDSFPDLHARRLNGDEPRPARARRSDPTPSAPHDDAKARGHAARIVAAVVSGAGSVVTAILALAGVLGWLVVGLVAGFSQEWLNVLFAVSGAVTLVMVIFIQHTTGRQFRALMLKLDELLRVDDDASDRYIGAERATLETQEDLEHDARQP